MSSPNRVMAQILAPGSVSTTRLWASATGACGSVRWQPNAGLGYAADPSMPAG